MNVKILHTPRVSPDRAKQIAKVITITGMDGRNHEVTLWGYGRPEWTTVDR
jgi:hypothetical protein